MTATARYPFVLTNAFFVTLSFERSNTLPGEIELPTEGQITVTDQQFPRLQVNFRIKTRDDSSVRFALELVGLFDYQGNQPERDRGLIKEFVQEKGLHMLWVYIGQMIRIITAQMGMNPIDLRTPLHFEFPSQEEVPTPSA